MKSCRIRDLIKQICSALSPSVETEGDYLIGRTTGIELSPAERRLKLFHDFKPVPLKSRSIDLVEMIRMGRRR